MTAGRGHLASAERPARRATLRQALGPGGLGRYLLVGGAAAATNFLSRFAWSLLLSYDLAVVAAYVTGMVVAFRLFSVLVFQRSTLSLARQIRNFTLVNLWGAALTWVTATLLARWFLPATGLGRHAEALGHAIAVCTPALSSWFLHRRFSFARGDAAD